MAETAALSAVSVGRLKNDRKVRTLTIRLNMVTYKSSAKTARDGKTFPASVFNLYYPM